MALPLVRQNLKFDPAKLGPEFVAIAKNNNDAEAWRSFPFLEDAQIDNMFMAVKLPLDGQATWEGMAERYFYVPKGTKTISYYWKGSPNAHRVFDPSGALALYGEYVMIPVPKGMDGKLWKFGCELPFYQIGFSNIPNLLAASPSSMLLPRELAKKDGLTIMERSIGAALPERQSLLPPGNAALPTDLQ